MPNPVQVKPVDDIKSKVRFCLPQGAYILVGVEWEWGMGERAIKLAHVGQVSVKLCGSSKCSKT